jgi:uncharacterized protein (TIGR00369 family)
MEREPPGHDAGAAAAAGEDPGEPVRFPPSECFGCSPTNPHGLHLELRRRGDEIFCEHVVAAPFDGAKGVVHGGIQAVLLDETMCAAVYFLRGSYVHTGELGLRYRRPCPSGVKLRVSAHVVAEEERYARVAGEIRAPDGELLTLAEGKFYYERARPPGRP